MLKERGHKGCDSLADPHVPRQHRQAGAARVPGTCPRRSSEEGAVSPGQAAADIRDQHGHCGCHTEQAGRTSCYHGRQAGPSGSFLFNLS